MHPKALVDFWFRNSSNIENVRPKPWRWAHLNTEGDIIAFRVTKIQREPKTIWVNEYKTGMISYHTEGEAKWAQHPAPVRITVKYQEVLD